MFQRIITHWEEGIKEIRTLSRILTVTGGISRNDFVPLPVSAAVQSVNTGTPFSLHFIPPGTASKGKACHLTDSCQVRGIASFVVSEDFVTWHHVLKSPKISLIMKSAHSDVGIGKFFDLSVLVPLSSYSKQAVLLHF